METSQKQGKLVQMRLSEETLKTIDRLRILIGVNNRAALISDVLNFAEEIIKEIRNGNEIHIHRKNGKQDKIIIPDLK